MINVIKKMEILMVIIMVVINYNMAIKKKI
jgi:hypothetical protein